MFRISAFRLMFVLLTLFSSLSVVAQTFAVDGITYLPIDETSVTAYKLSSDASGTVTIPQTVSNDSHKYTVVEISAKFATGNTKIGIVNMPKTITKIGGDAFSWCNYLSKVNLSESLRSIGDGAFRFSYLSSVTIPASVETIGNMAFCNCSSLSDVAIIDGSLKSIGKNCFYRCTALQNINIPESVEYIGSLAFSDCYKLATIKFPKTLTSIEAGMFEGCKALTRFELPKAVTTIGHDAFHNCTSLTTVVMINLESLTGIGIGAFQNTKIGYYSGYIHIPESVTYIGGHAFRGCPYITKVVLPVNLKKIEFETFCGCYNLQSITLPPTVETIGNDAFKLCTSLTEIVIPETAKYMDLSFTGCTSLTDLKFYAVKADDFHRIAFPASIKTLTIGPQVTRLPSMFLYSGCELQNLVIPNSVESIGEYAFRKAKIKSLTVGTGVKKIEKQATSESTEADVVKAFWNADKQPEGAEFMKGRVNFVPNESYSLDNQLVYPLMSQMFTEGKIVYIPTGENTCHVVSYVDDDAKELTIPASVTHYGTTYEVTGIAPYALQGNIHIEKLNVLAAAEIGEYAFVDCSSLKQVTIGTDVKSIGANAFSRSSNIKELNILAENPPACDESAFADIDKDRCTLSVPDDAVDKYKDAPQWGEFNFINKEPVPAQSLTIAPAAASLQPGETAELTAKVTPDDTTDKVAWSSSNEAVAKVSAAGIVTAVALGTAEITATCSNYVARCTVTVSNLSGVSDAAIEGVLIDIYDLKGSLIKARTTSDAFAELEPGLYIVRAGERSYKIAIGH